MFASYEELKLKTAIQKVKNDMLVEYQENILPAIQKAQAEGKDKLPYSVDAAENSKYGVFFLADGSFHSENILVHFLDILLNEERKSHRSQYHFKRTVLIKALDEILKEGFDELSNFNHEYKRSSSEYLVKQFLGRYTHLGFIETDEKTYGYYYYKNDSYNELLTISSFKKLITSWSSELAALNLNDESIDKEQNRQIIALSYNLLKVLNQVQADIDLIEKV